MASDDRYEIRFREDGEGFTSYADRAGGLEGTLELARRIAGRPKVRNVRVYRLRTVATLIERVSPAAASGEGE